MASKKPGPESVDEASKGTSPAANSGGSPGSSRPQKGIPGPTRTGGPVALKRALERKALPTKGI